MDNNLCRVVGSEPYRLLRAGKGSFISGLAV